MNRERVQMLRDMISGIPAKRLNLDKFYKKNGEPCGTIACIGGWAAIYPPFVEQGLARNVWGWPTYLGYLPKTSCALFFDIPKDTFCTRMSKDRGTHKQIALRRLDALLK